MVFLSIKWDKKKGIARVFSFCLFALLVTGLLNGAEVYKTSLKSEKFWPVWRKEVAKWKTDHSYSPKIWPEGWRMELKEELIK
jgi:hypothetical protein